MQLRTDARAAGPQVGELQRREQVSRWFEKGFKRQPIAFVVVLPLLKPRGRTKRDVSVNGLAEMCTEAVGVRQRIHECVDERAFRRHQFRVLTATRIDSKR